MGGKPVEWTINKVKKKLSIGSILSQLLRALVRSDL